jgi:hypothetical protein
MCDAKGDIQKVMMDASEPFDALEGHFTYMLPNESTVLSARPRGAANKQNRDNISKMTPGWNAFRVEGYWRDKLQSRQSH